MDPEQAAPGHGHAVTAVDLFCGAAGLSLGLRESGIRIAAGIDLDPACHLPFERNIGAPFIQEDISALAPETVDRLFGDASVRLLAGCAPCQPFSGYTTRRRAIDRRWHLLLDSGYSTSRTHAWAGQFATKGALDDASD